MIAAINTVGPVQLFGYAITGSAHEAGDEKFLTTISLKAGYRIPTN